MTTFVIVLVLSYLYHGLGITVGYHRLLSHRAFKCPLWLEYFIVSGGYLSFEGSPISWVSTHRVHHRYADQVGDPHRPADGFWHSFAGWLYHPIVQLTPQEVQQICPDLCRDKVYNFLDMGYTGNKHALVCGIACTVFRLIILFTLGPWALLANAIGSVTPFIGAFLVNSVCHLEHVGYRNFEVEDLSRNVWWVGLIALGEGWHNNHHAIPQSARHGLRPEEFDLSWLYIFGLQKLGLATDIRLPKDSKLAPIMTSVSGADIVPLASAQTSLTPRKALEQLQSARVIASQLARTCDQLSDQLGNARAQLFGSGTVSERLGQPENAAKVQLESQLMDACDRLAEQLSIARDQLGQQTSSTYEQLSDNLVTVSSK